jgi:hypothetical protein
MPVRILTPNNHPTTSAEAHHFSDDNSDAVQEMLASRIGWLSSAIIAEVRTQIQREQAGANVEKTTTKETS